MSLVVGLTGGIGSGKSTVARLLAARGAFVIDADQLAREVVAPGQPALAEIARSFGSAVLAADGSLDRAKLGAQVFADAEARARLNGIVHPEVRRLSALRIQEAVSRGVPVVVYDVPLLYETGLEASFPLVIVVDASEATRAARIVARDGLSQDETKARMDAQLPLSEKVRRADFVVDNGGTLDETSRQVEALYAELQRRSAALTGPDHAEGDT